MDHHIVLILTEMLDWVVLIGVAVKDLNLDFHEKFTFQYALREGGWMHQW